MEQLGFSGELKQPANADKGQFSGTFINNMKLPVHRWFRYSAGFSAKWVEREIQKHKKATGGKLNVVDPFAGSGTVLIEADYAGCCSLGVESHPFVSRIAKIKLLWGSDIDLFYNFSQSVIKKAKHIKADIESYPELIQKCFSKESLFKLDQLKKAYMSLEDGGNPSRLVWLAITSLLRECSHAGTAPWQYILPKKRKTGFVTDPCQAFPSRIIDFTKDMTCFQKAGVKPLSRLIAGDIRNKSSFPEKWGDLLISSPPYANNYDYADAVRLELCFWGEARSWKDLQTMIRPYLIRSCTQHTANLKQETYSILDHPLLAPIKGDIFHVCRQLDIIKESRGGKKPYHSMIAAYFLDLAKAWRQIRKIMKPRSSVCLVVGDSAPYGIHVPVEKWLGKLAVSSGFKYRGFEKIRDRNTKWKNRKHKIPLHEGRLWLEG